MVKIKKAKEPEIIIEPVFVKEPVIEIKKEVVPKLAIDYNSEGLNNMARKINEIIDYLNAL